MSTDDLIGKSVSHYTILKRLGEGGMGVVYQAEDRSLKRIVALKFIRPEAGRGGESDTRFRREAEAAAALNHPHIATIHEIGEADGRLFIAMEFVDGLNLREWLSPGPTDLAQGLDLAVQLAGALQAAHAKGIIHRDIKTDNIMVTREGSAKIMDFGLARPAVSVSATLTAGIVGTVPYMSPEQAGGDPVDHRTDLWSLGVVLYEMFAGRHPFRAKSEPSTLAAILTGDPEPLTRVRPGLPLELERIIGRCLEKNPEKRYAAAGGLRADLDRLSRSVDHQTVTSVKGDLPRPGPAFSLKKIRRRVLIPLGALLALAAAVLFFRPLRDPVARWLGMKTSPRVFSLAVLPFDVTGGESEDKAFSAGLVELLTSRLTQVERFEESLRVVPAREARELGSSGAARAPKVLRAERVITGSLSFAGDEIFVTLTLVDAEELRNVKSWDGRISRERRAALPDLLASHAAGLLDLTISAETRRVWSAWNTCKEEAAANYIQAKGYLQRYDNLDSVDIAIGQLRKVIDEIDAGCAVVYTGLGEAYRYKYNLTKDRALLDLAEQAAHKALELDPNMPEVRVILGVLYRLKGNLEASLREVETASRLDRRNESALREMGSTLEDLNRFDDAEKAYQRAIDLRPEAWSGYQYLGIFYLGQGRYADAEKSFLRITDLTPDNSQGYNLLGALYLRTGKNDKAVEMFRRSLDLQETPEAVSNLGTAYFFSGRFADAAAMYEKAILLGQNWSAIWGNLGDAYRFVRGSEGKARTAYETAVKLSREDLNLNPNDGDTVMRLARYLALLGETDAAVTEIGRARALLADTAEVLETAVQVYERAGKRDAALEALKKLAASGSVSLIEANPDLAELRKDPRYRTIIAGKR